MSRERARRRERERDYENPQYGDVREKVLDDLTNLYVQDKISLEQYENLAAEIQKAADPQAVLTSALIANHTPDAKADIKHDDFADERGDAFSHSHGHRQHLPPNPLSPPPYPSFGQFGRPGDFFLCIMGDRRVDGRMISNRSSASITLMGSTTIDLRGTQMPAAGLHLDLVAIMGEIKILVSPGTPVHFSVIPIMGEAISRADIPTNASSAGVLEVGGIALMGSVSVRVSSLK